MEADPVHGQGVGVPVGLLKGPQRFQIQFSELHVDFSNVDNTELPTSARARVTMVTCARALVGSSVLSTLEKSTCNSEN